MDTVQPKQQISCQLRRTHEKTRKPHEILKSIIHSFKEENEHTTDTHSASNPHHNFLIALAFASLNWLSLPEILSVVKNMDFIIYW